jgi:hypothetical protein
MGRARPIFRRRIFLTFLPVVARVHAQMRSRLRFSPRIRRPIAQSAAHYFLHVRSAARGEKLYCEP